MTKRTESIGQCACPFRKRTRVHGKERTPASLRYGFGRIKPRFEGTVAGGYAYDVSRDVLVGEPHAALASSPGRKEPKMSSRESGSRINPLCWAMALLFALGVEGALALPEVCTQCPGSVQNLSQVAHYCKKSSTLMVQARCCTNQKGTILGLDLQNCSLKDPGPNFTQAYTAIIIDLQTNPLKDDLGDTFRGFTQLETLILPQAVNCPGGNNTWENVSVHVNSKICKGQKNLCNGTGEPEMCPENGSCLPDGPGLSQCTCTDGFRGYKCMRQGSFSLLTFFGILGSTTLSISFLLWGTQRRTAKTS